ncbi:MAG: hypothetical protein RBT78_06615 [Kiritimatiellia bacterium]|jgi:hypothetical protein|nr:hypothetical protein [Kiritimatiellia bacterium]
MRVSHRRKNATPHGGVPGLLPLLAGLLLPVATLRAQPRPPAPAGPVPDAQTLFLLRADAEGKAFTDRTGTFTPKIRHGRVIRDAVWGHVLHLDGGTGSGVVVEDGGKIDFTGGMTFEAWVRFNAPMPAKGGNVAIKIGSFCWTLTAEHKFNNSWMDFPKETIYTNAPGQYDYYPVGGTMFNGLVNVETQRWVHLAIAYDPSRSAIYTWLDGMTDRYRYLLRGRQPLCSSTNQPLRLFQGVADCDLAAVRLSRGLRAVGPVAPLEIYMNQLPYEHNLMFTFDHLDPKLAYPLEATFLCEWPYGGAQRVRRERLEGPQRRDVLFEPAGWRNTLHTWTVQVRDARGVPVATHRGRVVNARPAADSPVRIGKDRTLHVNGRPLFPLMLYHARSEDFPLIRRLGFNLLSNGYNLRHLARRGKDRASDLQALWLESAEIARTNGLLVMANANTPHNHLAHIPHIQDHPALAVWYAFDEPWGDLTKLQESYNIVKLLTPDKPVLIVQNNFSRLQETAQGADIVGCDPYPIPSVSLRSVADATRATVQASAGRKPSWTVIPQYATKIPTVRELRCMAYLALTAGADGIGLYAWDDRDREGKGWYTGDHPQAVETLRAVFGELRDLSPILLAPNGEHAPRFIPDNRALHACVKTAGGKRYLLLANDARRAEQGGIEISGTGNTVAKTLADGGDGLTVRFVNGRATLELPALACGIFEIQP